MPGYVDYGIHHGATLKVDIVLNGRGKVMPAFGKALDTRSVADIINYERNACGNSEPQLITPAQVEADKTS